ncbi:MAG: inosine/xanthosine triphosphatase [Saprospiraceae bacterium]
MKSKIIVASKNPIKINATKLGFQKVFEKKVFEFEGVAVPSDVSDQPMTNQETLQGATNRATHAKIDFPNAKYWIGIEGGIEKVGEEMMAFAWIVILSNEKTGKARTGTFFLPHKVVQLINQGKELGEADDIVFGHSNSKQKNGAVGILTNNIIDRTQFYVEATVLALIPFLNKEIY